MAKYLIEESTLINMANAIRTATGTTDPISPLTMVVEMEKIATEGTPSENLDTEITEQDSLIEQIQTALQGKVAPSGGVDTSDATATEADIAIGKTAYAKGVKITGTHECSGSGEGTNFETREILITNATTHYCTINATVLDNGIVSSIHDYISAGESVTFSNVLLGSIYVFHDPSVTSTNKLFEDGIKLNAYQKGYYVGEMYGSSISLQYE